MDKSKIAIISTVINFELYSKSAVIFPKGIQKYVIDGRNGMHGINSIFYMMKKLKAKGIEWLIMADEDVLFVNPTMVFDIIIKMKSDKDTVCGVRDGGVIPRRGYNPYLINTFFSIINLKELESIWNKKKVLKNNYVLDNEFDDDLSVLPELYDSKSLFEPYYCFYLWLRRNKMQFYFLDANTPFENDEITNAVYFKEKLLLYHTWYARSYGIHENHTNRINSVFNYINIENEAVENVIIFKDKTFAFRNKIKKIKKKIDMKIQKYKKVIFNNK